MTTTRGRPRRLSPLHTSALRLDRELASRLAALTREQGGVQADLVRGLLAEGAARLGLLEPPERIEETARLARLGRGRLATSR